MGTVEFQVMLVVVAVLLSQGADLVISRATPEDLQIDLGEEDLPWLDRVWTSCPSNSYLRGYCANMCSTYKTSCRKECSLSLQGVFCGSFKCGQVAPGDCRGPNDFGNSYPTSSTSTTDRPTTTTTHLSTSTTTSSTTTSLDTTTTSSASTSMAPTTTTVVSTTTTEYVTTTTLPLTSESTITTITSDTTTSESTSTTTHDSTTPALNFDSTTTTTINDSTTTTTVDSFDTSAVISGEEN